MFFKQVIVCWFTIAVFSSCEQHVNTTVKKSIVQEELPDHTSWNIRVTFMDSSRVKAMLSARRARVFEQRKETLLDTNVKVVFNNAMSKQLAVLTSDSARIDDRTRNMFASGHVYVVSDSTKTSLATPNLMWDHDKQQLFTQDKVHIRTPTETIDGTGFISDQFLKNYRIFKVSGVSRSQ
ncbi:MAG: LPS export ABC transporter periplasmic protein LptC [Candidatus Kapabacteria bacterium]|nr:LPS export ABC transporter periplasmic protein LptC [Candidatus Kapabacteria bacterium]